MNIRDLDFQSRRRDHVSLGDFNRRLEHADQLRLLRDGVLRELGFLPGSSWSGNRWFRDIENAVLLLPAVPALVVALLLLAVLWLCQMLGNLPHLSFSQTLIFPLLGAIVAYQNWRRSRVNATVDDALRRKDVANGLIISQPGLLLP